MAVIIGSARSDERGKLKGGKAGDQTGKEVSTQAFYMHSKGWYRLRLKDANKAEELAKAMKLLCDNDNVGYDQNERLGVYRNGIDSTVKTEGDCSESVRGCLKYIGINVGDFTTANEASVLMATGLFEKAKVNSVNDVKNGDILVTCSKGHTVIVVSGAPRVIAPIPQPVAQGYTQDNFIADVMAILKVPTRTNAFASTVTISAKINKHHPLVTPLERYMKALGFYKGSIEADQGKAPSFGDGMTNAIKQYQRDIVKATAKNQDGEVTKCGATWRKLLGL